MSSIRIPSLIVALVATGLAVLMVSPGVAAADDRVIRGDHTVRSGVAIDDNIKIYGGTLTVHGR